MSALGLTRSAPGQRNGNAAEAVHEALLVEPRLVVGRDELDVAEGAQRTASERY